MTIAYEASAGGTVDFASTLTVALNASANPDRVVLVFATTDRSSATTIDSATYGGVSMTAHTAFLSPFTNVDGRLFYLVGAASGSNNVVVTFSDGNTKPKLLAAAYSGVAGVTALANVTPGFVSTISSTVSSAVGDVTVLMGCMNGQTSVAPSSPAVERFDADLASGIYGFLWDEAGASSVTIDGTAPGNAEWWATALNLQAAGGGGGGPFVKLTGNRQALAGPGGLAA